MARTDVKKSKEPCWVPCTLDGFDDEEHLIMPGTRENLQFVSDKSMVNKFRNGQFTSESDTNRFTEQWIKKHWLDWKNVGITHDTGEVEDPAECTLENRLIIANARGITFLLWLQEMSRQLAANAQQTREDERTNFRETDHLPVGQAGVEV